MRDVHIYLDELDNLFLDPKVVGRKIQFLSSDHPQHERLEIRGVIDNDVLVGRWFDRGRKCWRYVCKTRTGMEVYAAHEDLFEIKK